MALFGETLSLSQCSSLLLLGLGSLCFLRQVALLAGTESASTTIY